MISARFHAELERAGRRMTNGIRQAAGRVLANGGLELSRGRYYVGGPVVVTLNVPAGTWSVNGQDVETITYREIDEAAVLAWRDAIETARTNRNGN